MAPAKIRAPTPGWRRGSGVETGGTAQRQRLGRLRDLGSTSVLEHDLTQDLKQKRWQALSNLLYEAVDEIQHR